MLYSNNKSTCFGL